MEVTHQLEPHNSQQRPVYRFRIINESGAYVEFTNWGARWITAMIPDANGHLSNVIQGYETLDGYLADPYYMGAVIGRFANRIGNASFTIDDTSYQLEANDGCNTNHGGTSGFHQKLWQWELLSDGVCFSLHSPDGCSIQHPSSFLQEVGFNKERKNLSLNKPAYASSTTHGEAALITDGKSDTRWAAAVADNEWVYVDLGSVQPVGYSL